MPSDSTTGGPPGPVAPPGFLSPAVRRVSCARGVDPTHVTGTGAGGRVTVRDVELAASAPTPARATAAAARRVQLSALRVRSGQNLRRSLDTAVHALVVTEVDYHAVERARAAAAAAGAPLTYLPFVARATIDALRRYPEMNATFHDDELRVYDTVNLGVAVDLDHQGLVVPVIRDADSLRLRALADRVREVAELARQRRLSPDGYAAGTFTITNVGRYGTLMAGPIINHPQVAILSTDGVKMRPVAVADGRDGYAVAVHPVGNLSLSFDHRAFDGAYAAAFLALVRDTLEARDWSAEL